MMRDAPDVAEIVRTVGQYTQTLGENAGQGTRYEALIASYLLKIAERELADGAAFDERDRRRLTPLVSGPTPDEDIRWALCRAIRSGDLDDRWSELVEIAVSHVVDKVRMSRPDHLLEKHQGSSC